MKDKLTKHEILIIRACKGTSGKERSRRLLKIAQSEYWYEFDGLEEIAPILLDIVLKIHEPSASLVKWAAGIHCERRQATAFATKDGTQQIISKLRHTAREDMPEEWVAPIKFRRKGRR